MVRALACDLASRGITVNAIAPGFIDSRMSRFPDGSSQHDTEVFRTVYLKHRKIPLGRAGCPDDLAGPAAFLVSSDACLHHRPDPRRGRRGHRHILTRTQWATPCANDDPCHPGTAPREIGRRPCSRKRRPDHGRELRRRHDEAVRVGNEESVPSSLPAM